MFKECEPISDISHFTKENEIADNRRDSRSSMKIEEQNHIDTNHSENSEDQKTKVTVIIVNYNTGSLLRDCLNSILKSKDIKNIDINIVDNASTDNSVEIVRQNFPQVNLVENEQNIGFARANNQILKTCQAPYILLLNPDIILKDNTLSRVLNFMEQNKDIGIATAKLIRPNGELDYGCHRGIPTIPGIISYLSGFSRLFPKSKIFGSYHLTYLDIGQTSEIDAVAGAFMLVRQKAIQEIGLLDESFFMFGEDIDLCWRMKKEGWKVYYYAEAEAVHYGRQSRKTNPILSKKEFWKSAEIFYRKHYENKHPKWMVWFTRLGIKILGQISLWKEGIRPT